MNMCSRGFVSKVFVSNKSSEFQLGEGAEVGRNGINILLSTGTVL